MKNIIIQIGAYLLRPFVNPLIEEESYRIRKSVSGAILEEAADLKKIIAESLKTEREWTEDLIAKHAPEPINYADLAESITDDELAEAIMDKMDLDDIVNNYLDRHLTLELR